MNHHEIREILLPARLELFDMEVTELGPEEKAQYYNWKFEHPGISVTSYIAIDGKRYQFTYKASNNEPRYKEVYVGKKVPGHIKAMIDNKLKRLVVSKSAYSSPSTHEGKYQDPLPEAHRMGVDTHPNIAQIYDIAVDSDNNPYNIMEYLPNGTLTDWITENRSLEEIASVIHRISAGMSHIHEHRKMLYQDMKPDNVGFDEVWNPKIMDFGSTFNMNGDGTVSQRGDGTQSFKSPEQLDMYEKEPLTVRSDIYNLAATFFLIFTENISHWEVGWTLRNFISDLNTPIPFRSRYQQLLSSEQQKELSQVFHVALNQNSQERYASVNEFDQEIQRVLTMI